MKKKCIILLPYPKIDSSVAFDLILKKIKLLPKEPSNYHPIIFPADAPLSFHSYLKETKEIETWFDQVCNRYQKTQAEYYDFEIIKYIDFDELKPVLAKLTQEDILICDLGHGHREGIAMALPPFHFGKQNLANLFKKIGLNLENCPEIVLWACNTAKENSKRYNLAQGLHQQLTEHHGCKKVKVTGTVGALCIQGVQLSPIVSKNGYTVKERFNSYTENATKPIARRVLFGEDPELRKRRRNSPLEDKENQAPQHDSQDPPSKRTKRSLGLN